MDRYSTRNQAELVLRNRGYALESIGRVYGFRVAALARVRADTPDGWTSVNVKRDSPPRFLSTPEDVIIVVGPDGLVASVAKYVDA